MLSRKKECALIFTAAMTWVILIIAFALWVTGCSYTKHTVFRYDEELRKMVPASETEHLAVLANEKIRQLYYLKDDKGVHLELGGVEISPENLEFRAFKFGVRVGRAEGDIQ